jgi:hypothetical protein
VGPAAAGLSPSTTVQRKFRDWRNRSFLRAINHLKAMAMREMEGRIQSFGRRNRQLTRKNDRK